MKKVRKEKGAFQTSWTWMHYLGEHFIKKGHFICLSFMFTSNWLFFSKLRAVYWVLHPSLSNVPQHNYFWPAIIDFHIEEASGYFQTKVFCQSEYI